MRSHDSVNWRNTLVTHENLLRAQEVLRLRKALREQLEELDKEAERIVEAERKAHSEVANLPARALRLVKTAAMCLPLILAAGLPWSAL